MEFAIDRVALGVDQLESVRSVSVHESVTIGDAAVGEDERKLMRALRS